MIAMLREGSFMARPKKQRPARRQGLSLIPGGKMVV